MYAAHHGDFVADIPLILNGDTSKPYRSIELKACVSSGRISVDSDRILMQPVSLGASVAAIFTIYVEFFAKYALCKHCTSIGKLSFVFLY